MSTLLQSLTLTIDQSDQTSFTPRNAKYGLRLSKTVPELTARCKRVLSLYSPIFKWGSISIIQHYFF